MKKLVLIIIAISFFTTIEAQSPLKRVTVWVMKNPKLKKAAVETATWVKTQATQVIRTCATPKPNIYSTIKPVSFVIKNSHLFQDIDERTVFANVEKHASDLTNFVKDKDAKIDWRKGLVLVGGSGTLALSKKRRN